MKNAFWMVLIVVAAIIGAMLGPSLLDGLPPGIALAIIAAFLLGLIALIVWSLSGNRGARRADATTEAAARTLRAPPGKARIYFIRRGFVASLQGMNVTIDGHGTGQIKSGQFLMAEVEPGDHRVNAKMARGGKSTAATMDLSLGAGEAAFIRATIEMGALAASTKLSRLDEADARDDLSAVRMMLWNDTPAR